MRWTILVLATVLIHATAFAQTVTISGADLSFKDISSAIKKQTGYLLFSKKGDLAGLKSVSVSQMPLKDFLDLLTKDRGLDYTIVRKTIIISPKPVSPGPMQVSPTVTALTIRVVDANGKPLPGATILLKQHKISGVTGIEGTTKINVSENDVLTVTFMGFEPRSIQLTAQVLKEPVLTVSLAPAESRLNEVTVVSTGYQTIEKEKTTGAVTTVNSADLSKRNTVNILDNLEGIVPGLVRYNGVTTIRGVSTMRANTGVLVVVDGLPIEGSIADINPYDVETINVLKDAAAASIYGARASNGVIVVTTRRAKQVGKTQIQASANVTYMDKPDYSYYNYMTPAQQVDWESNYYKWWFSGASGTAPDPVGTVQGYIEQGRAIDPIQYAYYRHHKQPAEFSEAQLEDLLNQYRKNNFQQQYHDHALRNQVLQQYNLALRTNNIKSQSNLVVNYKTTNSGIINAFNRQLNLFYKGSYAVGKWLDAEYGVNSVIGKAQSHNSELATNPFNVPAYISLLNNDGSRAQYSTWFFNEYNTMPSSIPALQPLGFNHLDELERDYVNTSTLNTRYYLNLNFRILPGLTFNPMFQYEDNRTDISAYAEAESYTMRWLQDIYTSRSGSPGNYTYTHLLPEGGKLATTNIKSPGYTARAQVNYNKETGRHAISTLAGVEFRQARAYGSKGLLLGYDDQLQTQSTNSVNFGSLYNVASSFLVQGYSPQAFDYPALADAMGLVIDTKHRFASAYANATYTYNRRYNLFGSIRKDYADLFGSDSKYRGRPLWSVGGSWIISREDFLSDVQAVNFLSLRASYGLTGNIDPTTPSVLAATTGINNDTQLPNATVTTPPNAQLRWEKTASINLGLDFHLFNNRLKGTFDWYKRKGTDLFAQKRLDPSEGFRSMVINNASMINNGLELSISYDWIKSSRNGGFNWTSGLVASLNKNKITYVDQVATNPFVLATGDGFKTGYPVHSLFSFRYAGLDSAGQPLWYNTAGVKTGQQLGGSDMDALVFSGNADPKTAISFNNELRYKGISLLVYAVYYGGHYYRARPAPNPVQLPQYMALPSYLANGWTNENKNTDIPGSGQYYRTNLAATQMPYSDFIVRPADFIRIRNVVLAYDFPTRLASGIKATNAQLRLQVNNPRAIWIRQKDAHVDPETGGLPIPASYVLGANLNF